MPSAHRPGDGSIQACRLPAPLATPILFVVLPHLLHSLQRSSAPAYIHRHAMYRATSLLLPANGPCASSILPRNPGLFSSGLMLDAFSNTHAECAFHYAVHLAPISPNSLGSLASYSFNPRAVTGFMVASNPATTATGRPDACPDRPTFSLVFRRFDFKVQPSEIIRRRKH